MERSRWWGHFQAERAGLHVLDMSMVCQPVCQLAGGQTGGQSVTQRKWCRLCTIE